MIKLIILGIALYALGVISGVMLLSICRCSWDNSDCTDGELEDEELREKTEWESRIVKLWRNFGDLHTDRK